MLTVVNDAAGSRLGPGLIEHQTEACIGNPAHPACVDPVSPSLPVDNAAERSFGQSRYPRNAAPEPGKQTADIELAAAHSDLEESRLVEALVGGWR